MSSGVPSFVALDRMDRNVAHVLYGLRFYHKPVRLMAKEETAVSDAFGQLLRQLRSAAGVTMGQLARHLGVSVPYVSDVERGHRPPFMNEKILKVAELLGTDANQLLRIAAESRGAFVLDAKAVSPRAREVGAALMRGWPLSEEELEEIQHILAKRGGEA